jgi:hypothetical protein
MAGFDDSLVREYFEMNGFFVRQSRKYAVQSRRKRADEEGDLLVINPSPIRGSEAPFQLFSSDLPKIGAAVVAVKAWHTTKAITPTMIKKGDLLEFVREEAVKAAKEALQVGSELKKPKEAAVPSASRSFLISEWSAQPVRVAKPRS